MKMIGAGILVDTEFEIFKQSVSHLKEKENDLEPSDKTPSK
jgi:hypothetical protein